MKLLGVALGRLQLLSTVQAYFLPFILLKVKLEQKISCRPRFPNFNFNKTLLSPNSDGPKTLCSLFRK